MQYLGRGEGWPQGILGFNKGFVFEERLVVQDSGPNADCFVLELEPPSASLRVTQKCPEKPTVSTINKRGGPPQ